MCVFVMTYSAHAAIEARRHLKRTRVRSKIIKELNQRHDALMNFNRLLEKIGVLDEMTSYRIEVNSLSNNALRLKETYRD